MLDVGFDVGTLGYSERNYCCGFCVGRRGHLVLKSKGEGSWHYSICPAELVVDTTILTFTLNYAIYSFNVLQSSLSASALPAREQYIRSRGRWF